MHEVIDDLTGLHSLAEEWNSLAARFNTPLLRHEWFAACAEACCPPGRLSILIIRSQQELRAIAPLVLIQRDGIERLEEPLGSALGEPGGLIYRDEAALRELVRAMVALRRPIVLAKLPSASPAVSVLGELCRGKGMLSIRDAPACPWLPITSSWAEFEAKMSSSRRYNLRRKYKLAEKSGPVEVEIISPTPANLTPYLDEVFRVEAAGWKGRNDSSILSTPWLKRFLESYSLATARLGLLRLYFFRVNCKAIAVRLAVEYARRIWELKIGYDEAWAKCSPGILLTHETLRHTFEQGLEAYEFLGIDAAWEHLWTDHTHAYVFPRFYPYSGRGMLGLGTDVPRFVFRKFMHSIKNPPTLFRASTIRGKGK
jgi:CelD/BcsL family acetyltransferase involved in cellulose biosynthesis